MKTMTPFRQRFGVPPQVLARHAGDYADRLSDLQMKVATVWANNPDATPTQIAGLVGGGHTASSVRSAANRVRQRITQRMQLPQGRRPLAAKLGAIDLDPVLTAAAMRRMTPRQRAIFGAAAAFPTDRTGDIARRLAMKRPSVSACAATIAANIAFVKATGREQLLRDAKWEADRHA